MKIAQEIRSGRGAATGFQIAVPLFVEQGDMIAIGTRAGKSRKPV